MSERMLRSSKGFERTVPSNPPGGLKAFLRLPERDWDDVVRHETDTDDTSLRG
jgi:hypothetical protein